jgi:hypothetical protein
MRTIKPQGIHVSPSSTPDFASSRRHFVSAAALAGAALTAVLLAPRQALAQGKGKGKGGGGETHCFLKGTQILTPQGERPIEDLQIGDLVLTVSGEAQPIKWIARMRFERDGQTSWNDDVAPIKIARGAFNGNLPHSDLYVSSGHRFFINGLLIPAGDLINEHSITRMKSASSDVLEYLHIELEDHDVILANGVPAETLGGNASRKEFDNFDQYVALYGAVLTHQAPYAPIMARYGRRQALRSHLRGALAPIWDRRQSLDIIHDELATQARRRRAA